MDRLIAILKETMNGYATTALTGETAHLTHDPDNRVFAVVDIGDQLDESRADAFLIAHIDNDFIVIDRDMNDKLLVDALIQNGIPREQIILAYAGETLPDTASIS